MTHPIFGQLEYDEDFGRGYVTKKTINFAGKETEVELVLSLLYTQNDEIEEGHIKTYQALMQNWDSIVPRVLQSIMEYQNESWDDNDHTASFPEFQTHEDVLANLDCFIEIKIHAKADCRYAVLVFGDVYFCNASTFNGIDATTNESGERLVDL